MKFFLPAFIVATATSINAITLLQVLQTYPQLSSLSAYINSSSASVTLLSQANNFTFLAPSNLAISKYLTANPNVLTTDLLAATLQYSLLKGGYPSLSFTDTPLFVPTYLNNATYANVTGGQRMALLGAPNNGPAEVITGNKTLSSSTSADIVCTGGIIHIIDTVPSIPLTTVSEITAANLEYFVSILSTGNYLNANNTYVNNILEIPDVTYFIPNSEDALAAVQALVKNSTTTPEMLKESFEYHVVNGSVAYSTDLQDGMTLRTAQGGSLKITMQGGDVFVNAAKIVASDYLVANGVVHVIDSLLNPSNTSGPKPLSLPTTTPSAAGTSATPTSASGATISTHAPLSDISSPISHHSPTTKTTIGIAIGVSLFVILLISISTFYLVRRSRSRARNQHLNQRNQNMNQFLTATTGSNFSPGSSIRSVSQKGKNIYVHREVEVQRQVVPWGLRTDIGSVGMREMHIGKGEVGFRSMDVDGYGSQECVAGPPYIPPRSPDRGVGSLRREFF